MMETPDREKIKELLLLSPYDWKDEEKIDAYLQLKDLYEHWYREEL